MDPMERNTEFSRSLIACQDRLYAYAQALLGDPVAVEDVVQQTNLILWRKAAEFQPGTEFGAWACRVAFYEILKHRQRLARDRLLFDDDLLTLLAERVEQRSETASDRRAALRHCLSQLTSSQRDLLTRRYGPEASVQALAAQLNRPVASVSQTLYRLRITLTECIERAVRRGAVD